MNNENWIIDCESMNEVDYWTLELYDIVIVMCFLLMPFAYESFCFHLFKIQCCSLK